MERITITIQTGNAAFADYPSAEITRILRKLAQRFEQDGIPPDVLLDVNGNRVGTVVVEGD